SRRRHTRSKRDWSSDVCSSDLLFQRRRGGNGGLDPSRPDRDPGPRADAIQDPAGGRGRRDVQGRQRRYPGDATRQHTLRPLPLRAKATLTVHEERSMKRVIQNERGMALALAIVALVVVGALIAGAFFAGTQEQRVGENA